MNQYFDALLQLNKLSAAFTPISQKCCPYQYWWQIYSELLHFLFSFSLFYFNCHDSAIKINKLFLYPGMKEVVYLCDKYNTSLETQAAKRMFKQAKIPFRWDTHTHPHTHTHTHTSLSVLHVGVPDQTIPFGIHPFWSLYWVLGMGMHWINKEDPIPLMPISYPDYWVFFSSVFLQGVPPQGDWGCP